MTADCARAKPAVKPLPRNETPHPMPPDPIRPSDPEALALARRLLAEADHAALGVLHPDTGGPHVSRIALALAPEGVPLTLVSHLALHTRALLADARAALMVGEPGDKGDPLTHPRLMLTVRAAPVARDSADHAALRAHWLACRPKATLYVDLPDFQFIRLWPQSGTLNAGFGRAFSLQANQLTFDSGETGGADSTLR